MQIKKEMFCRRRGGRYRTIAADGVILLDGLKERFAEFHRENPPNSRIPVSLRTAVIDAIGRGIPPTRLRRTCRISTGQLTRWQAIGRPPGNSDGVVPRPHVFSVVDTPTPPAATAAPPMPEELELRLGRWTVSVRMAGQPAIGRR